MQYQYRLHGEEPNSVVLLHGGPGAWGEIFSLADLLKDRYGLIEPFQMQPSLDGQLEELHGIIKENAFSPVAHRFLMGCLVGLFILCTIF